jgi:hypothetical protein
MPRLVKWPGRAVGGIARVIALFKIGAEATHTQVDRRSWLLDKAFSLPVASKYGRLPYYQTNSTFCGPASLVNVFRSLGEAPGDEAAVLRNSGKCGLGFCWMGLTLNDLGEVARRQGRHRVTVLRNLTQEAFRDHLRRSNRPELRYVVNFTRKKIFGAGGGHHSPIGGYLEPEDMVLVLDVNEDFGPWTVSRELLYNAVDTLDGAEKRGLLLIE